MTTHGRRLLQQRWTDHEFRVLGRLHDENIAVPFPIGFDEERLDMQYLGDRSAAAPQLAKARLYPTELGEALRQTMEGLTAITGAGWAHGDLSAFNLLWWEDAVWFIDFPQAVDIAANPQGLGFLHRDVTNVCRWFTQRGIEADGEAYFAELLAAAF